VAFLPSSVNSYLDGLAFQKVWPKSFCEHGGPSQPFLAEFLSSMKSDCYVAVSMPIKRLEATRTTQSNKSQIIAILLCRSDLLDVEWSPFHLWFAQNQPHAGNLASSCRIFPLASFTKLQVSAPIVTPVLGIPLISWVDESCNHSHPGCSRKPCC
jgi:hypothetical protein